MDSGGAGGIFSRAYFLPPFVPPISLWQGQGSRASGAMCPREGTMNSEKRERARSGQQSCDFRRWKRRNVIPACTITLGGYGINVMLYKGSISL